MSALLNTSPDPTPDSKKSHVPKDGGHGNAHPPWLHTLKVSAIRHEFDDTWSYFLELPPEKNPALTFIPGQFIHLVAPGAPVSKPTVRHMSIASIPEDGHLRIAMSLASGSPYKQAFRSLRPGQYLQVFGITGSFSLASLPEKTPLVFIAGGIGITPIMSLMRHIADKQLNHPWGLIHVANTHLFRSEIDQLFPENPRIYCSRHGIDSALDSPGLPAREAEERPQIGTPPPGQGHRTFEVQSTQYFLCGSGGFLASITRKLLDRGIPPESIRTEDFDH
ncbi:ferredoxin--NADP reductase [Spirochaeta lutea]|uniref:FAD-binding FR-type domain-containing protein n=1 Tax=Spirochaeta lutea TaxID=1480694 RepID=A0A098QSX3_9SPIO|nr:FAD-dependent oxidoreductase [Spirochaeta lutea]KGE70965.1 hypothetical protein DC28_13585 [Spirochaeta lutea]